MAQFISKGLISIAALMQIGDVAAAMQLSIPARFVEDEQSLQKSIVFPDVIGDVSLNVYCIVDVNKTGHLERNYCFASKKVDQAFRDAITTAGKQAKVTPAIVLGEAQPVRIQYRVAFVRKDNSTAIGVYPNWGSDVAKYGNDYDGPQRISKTTYPSACRNRRVIEIGSSARHKRTKKTPAFFVLTSVSISASGMPDHDISFEWSDRKLTGPCPARIKYILENAEYIPGRHNGESVAATYQEPWGKYEAMYLD